MSDDRLTHASFFSGVGGLDLGLERAGWRTVSFSEIDPYASAVLAQRWPGVPNLGSIVDIADRWGSGQFRESASHQRSGGTPDNQQLMGWDAASRAVLWTGGFPCQDLSVAGKRRGMGEGTRSGLAYSFLALAERHRPRFVLLENVPGLLSSHGGRDMAALLGALVELGYGVGYRIVDARYFGVPQRRRRVFILGDSLGGRAGAERASEVLSVGSRCGWHPPTGVEAGPGVAARLTGGSGGTFRSTRAFGAWESDPIAGTVSQRDWKSPNEVIVGTLNSPSPHNGWPGSDQNAEWHIIPGSFGPSPDPDRMRAPDGLAGRLDGSRDVGAYNQRDRIYADLAPTLDSHAHSVGDAPLAFTKSHNDTGTDGERWDAGREARSMLVTGTVSDDPTLPLGLDSHRYRCCGNGVVASVSEWIGHRLAAIA